MQATAGDFLFPPILHVAMDAEHVASNRKSVVTIAAFIIESHFNRESRAVAKAVNRPRPANPYLLEPSTRFAVVYCRTMCQPTVHAQDGHSSVTVVCR